MREVILGWFVMAIFIEVVSTAVLLVWLRRRGVRPVFGLTGVPGYLEREYLRWCRSQGRSGARVVAWRIVSLANVILAAITAIPIFVSK